MPDAVRFAESFTDRYAELFPEETAVIANAVASRRAEFMTVRANARDALRQLGLPPAPLLPGELGAPRWPPGVVGSMTHCTGYRAAAVARVGEIAALGIDAEPNQPLPDGVLEVIAGPEELSNLKLLPRRSDHHWDRLLFCAKETVYKAWSPLVGEWLDFDEVTVIIRPDGQFIAQILKSAEIPGAGPLLRFAGRWVVDHGLVATAIASEPP